MAERDALVATALNLKLSFPVSLPPHSDLQGAVEEVLPTLKEQGISVFIMSERCDVDGIESLSDKIQQASDEAVSPQLRANVHYKSPALYIYTSGTTGEPAFTSESCSLRALTLSEGMRTIKMLCL